MEVFVVRSGERLDGNVMPHVFRSALTLSLETNRLRAHTTHTGQVQVASDRRRDQEKHPDE
jgi:hypothetical protein